MAYEGWQFCPPGLKAGADLSTKQYYFVKLSAANTVVVCAATTDKPIGILQNRPAAAGDPATVCVIGETKVNSDAALSVGASIGTAADGQAAAYTAADTTKFICGQVVVASAAAGGFATAIIDCANVRALA